MRKAANVALAAVGPLAVALLRFVLPYYTASGNKDAATDIAANPGTESLVLWLGADRRICGRFIREDRPRREVRSRLPRAPADSWPWRSPAPW